MKEKGHLGRPRCRWEDNIRMISSKCGGKAQNVFIWVRIWTSDRLLWTQ